MGKFTFGPVPSRRLGFSLGIDIIPRKTCTFDCIYCQVGKTTNQELSRKSFFNPDEIVEEIITVTKDITYIDHITFSGSGEPTLNSDIGWIIREVKKRTDIPVAVITNSSLLSVEDVRNDIGIADAVLPSLDAVSEGIFQYINKPHSLIGINTIIEGIKKFSTNYKGKIWLEIMLIKGINTSTGELEKFKKIAEYLGVEKVQLNTIIRPPIDRKISGLTSEELDKISEYFGESTEVICDFTKKVERKKETNWSEMVMEILKRRSLTLSDIVKITGIPGNVAIKTLKLMEDEGNIKRVNVDSKIFYIIND